MKKHVVYLLALAVILMHACQKEVSFEAGKNRSHGSLQSDATSDCLPKIINGAYVAGKKLAPDTNTVTVDVNVINTGSYVISSDTVNGYYFRASGIFATQGINTITLKGNGTPLAAGVNNFVISYDSTICDIAVNVLPSGAGGPAAFTLASGNCSAVINGTYTLNTALTSSNTVNISVNVATIGTYTITTVATGGMTFSATGAFVTTGVQTVTLKGNGTPTTGGNNTIPVTAGTSSCSFVVNVVGASVGTLGSASGVCTPATPNGTYTIGTALTTGNTVQVQVTVTTVGGYNISTNTVTGFSFSGSGTFASTGVQNVILNGIGTPTTAGAQTFTVTYGGSSCTFVVTVAATSVSDYYPRTTNSNWSYKFDNNPADTLLRKVSAATKSALGNSFNIFLENDGSGLDSSGYYRKTSSGDYYQYLDVGYLFGLDNAVWGEYIFLKDYVAAGTTWTSPNFNGTYTDTASGTVIPLTVRIKETIQQKDVAVTVQGTTYQNTIVVKEEYEYSVNGGTTWSAFDIYTMNYFSRNIGLIKFEPFDSMGSIYLQELTRYQVF